MVGKRTRNTAARTMMSSGSSCWTWIFRASSIPQALTTRRIRRGFVGRMGEYEDDATRCLVFSRATCSLAASRAELVCSANASCRLVWETSVKQHVAPTFKRGFGFHPLAAFCDNGSIGTGEPLAMLLRKGNAGSNTVADHITFTTAALQQLPGKSLYPGKKVLIRTDGAGGTQGYLEWLTRHRLSYSVGYTLPFDTAELYQLIPENVWTSAYDADGEPRDGADVAQYHRPARSDQLAQRDAGHRPPGTSPPRSTTPVR